MSKGFQYKIKVNAIDYCVEEENLDSTHDLEHMTEQEIEQEIERLKKQLPQSMELEITCEQEDLDDQVVNIVSDITGWLNNSVDYQIISKKQVW